jgi:glycolate oxidase
MAARRPPPLDAFLTRLSGAMGARLRTDDAALEAASHDASHAAARLPAAVLQAQSTAEVSAICRAAQELGVALVPRGAGTGKAGGCVPGAGEVVVDLSRMGSLLAMAPQDLYAVVQPGLVTAELDREAGAHGLMYPPDPASWESCSLGGNIATNAGGPRAVKYGVTARYVWGLEVVLMGGEVLRCGRRSIKGVAGLDLAGLFVGSEGTLGFITEATLHLVPAPRGVETAWVSFASPRAASDAAAALFTAGHLPRMLELLDAPALAAARTHAGWSIPEAGAALLVETDGPTEGQAREELLRLCERASAAGGAAIVASSERERERMRRTRRLVSASLKERYPFKVSDDIAVPRSQMPALLEEAASEAATAGLAASAYGHLGDGNLHVNLLCATAEARQRAQPVREHLWRFAVARGGTISGEHGIGLTKREALGLEQGPGLLALQRRVKAAFDPAGLLNPGKVWPAETGP